MATVSAAPHASAGAELYLAGVSKSFGGVAAIQDATFSVAAGEILALVGPSGAGKTTLCRIIAGLEQPDAGSTFVSGHDMAGRPAGERHMALMFESYALYPHLTVRENVMSPLRARAKGRDCADGAATVDRLLALLEMTHLCERHPAALSGGQKQRVALARALVQQPSALMLDEPMSHLDAKLRHKLRGGVRRMLGDRPHPTIWCTPDGLEALSVGDRVAVLNRGRIEQIGTPADIWLRPASIRVAKLFGDPPTNVLAGKLEIRDGRTFFARPEMSIELPDSLAASAAGLPSRDVFLGLRPKGIALNQGPGEITAQVYSTEAFGKHSIVTLRLDGGDLLKIKTQEAIGSALGSPISFTCDLSDSLLFDGQSGALLRRARKAEQGI
jgi:ABC-type sugar transport system ATPase subunit